MKHYIFDTNALISFVTDRNPEQQEKISPLFESVGQLKAGFFCHQHVLTEFIFVLDRVYHVSKVEIVKMVSDLVATPGIDVIHEIDFGNVFKYWPDPIQDFGDAVIASVGIMHKSATIVTFDKKFSSYLSTLGLRVHLF